MQDVYYSPEYYDLWEKNDGGKAFCFVFKYADDLALYPFLLNRINDLGYKLEELITIYKELMVTMELFTQQMILILGKDFTSHLIDSVKATILLQNSQDLILFWKNYKFSKNFYDVIYNRQTVCIDLTQKYDSIYKDYTRSAKQNLQTAVDADLNYTVYKKKFSVQKRIY